MNKIKGILSEIVQQKAHIVTKILRKMKKRGYLRKFTQQNFAYKAKPRLYISRIHQTAPKAFDTKKTRLQNKVL